MHEGVASAALRAIRGSVFVSVVAAIAAALVVGILNAGFPDITFICVSGAVWAAGDLALISIERTGRAAARHKRVRWRVGLAVIAITAAFVCALRVSQGGYVKELVATSALALSMFTGGILALKLFERRNPLEVDWRERLKSRYPSYGFLMPPRRNVLVIGASLDARMIAGAISYAMSPLRVVGAVRFHDEDGDRPVCGARVLGYVDEIEDVLAQLKINGITVDAFVTPSFSDRTISEPVREALSRNGGATATPVLSDLSEIKRFAHSDNAYRKSWRARRMLRRKLLTMSRTWPSTQHAVLKRGLDIALSALALLVLSPLFAVAYLGVRLSVGSPVLFWQERPGRFGRKCRIYKFRSMRAADRRLSARTSDKDRLTPFGAFLRRSRIDELPQLVSVLKGEMSMVGPRPLLPEDMPDLAEARLLIRPGISGWAQVNGGHLLEPDEKIALDIWYAKRANIALDVWILLKSLRVILTGDRRKEDVIAQAQAELDDLVLQLQKEDWRFLRGRRRSERELEHEGAGVVSVPATA